MRFFGKTDTVGPPTLDRIPQGYRLARSADDIANEPWAATALEQIQSLVALPSQYFSLFYRTPLVRFLVLTQSCDSTVVIDRLQAVVDGLKLRRAYILPKGVNPDSIREKKDRWTYAVFVAVLMYDLASLLKPLNIVKPDLTGDNIEQWSPVANESLALPYAFQAIEGVIFPRSVTPLFLHHLFDEVCLTWLCQDHEALVDAVESMVNPCEASSIGPLVIQLFNLNSKKPESGGLSSIKADSDSFTKPEDSHVPDSCVPDRQSGIQLAKVTEVCNLQDNKPSARTLGRLFLKWLETTLSDNGQSLQHQQLIHPVPQGLALSTPAIFQHYGASAGYEWKQVQNGFLKLRLHVSCDDTQGPVHTLALDDGRQIRAIVIPSFTV